MSGQTAFDTQVAGDHYKKMKVQPQHFAMVNGWDSGAFSILKYVSRHRSKRGREDLEKGLHFVALRDADIAHATPPRNLIPMSEYIAENGIEGEDRQALVYLEWWVQTGTEHWRDHLRTSIGLLIEGYALSHP